MLRAIVIAGLLLGLTPGVARGAPWHWPVRGEVVERFSYDPADPFRAGQRRGLSLSAPPGAPVRATCAGTVAFAGAVAGEPTVSVDCGALRATYQGIGAISVRGGEAVAREAPIARVDRSGLLRFGARRGDGYLDPATLLVERGPGLGPAPTRVARRPPVPPATEQDRPPATVPPAPSPARAPLVAWLGLGLLALAVPVGRLRRHRARSRAVEGARASA